MIFDLNVNNYNFNEIQQLFNLELDSEISHEDLKSAKSKVLSMHPDKSKLSSKYFIFYKKAFEILVQYYQSQPNVKIKAVIDDIEVMYDTDNDGRRANEIKKQLEKMDKSQFSKYFNDLYNENMIDKEKLKKRVERNRWFEESLPQTTNVQMSKNINNCIEEFKRRNIGGQICKHSEIQSDNHASGSKIYDDDDDDDDENNSYIYCNPSGKLLFDDLRKVHKNESVFNIDVMSNKQEPLYKNCDDLRSQRVIDENREQTINEFHEYSKVVDKNNIYNRKLIKQKQSDIIKNEEYLKINEQIISKFIRISN
jgi:hypothetical protein